MNEVKGKDPNSITLSKDTYIALLEAINNARNEVAEVRNTLQAEYNFAEEKIKEINTLSEEIAIMKRFINSDKDLKSRFRSYKKPLSKSKSKTVNFSDLLEEDKDEFFTQEG